MEQRPEVPVKKEKDDHKNHGDEELEARQSDVGVLELPSDRHLKPRRQGKLVFHRLTDAGHHVARRSAGDVELQHDQTFPSLVVDPEGTGLLGKVDKLAQRNGDPSGSRQKNRLHPGDRVPNPPGKAHMKVDAPDPLQDGRRQPFRPDPHADHLEDV